MNARQLRRQIEQLTARQEAARTRAIAHDEHARKVEAFIDAINLAAQEDRTFMARMVLGRKLRAAEYSRNALAERRKAEAHEMRERDKLLNYRKSMLAQLERANSSTSTPAARPERTS